MRSKNLDSMNWWALTRHSSFSSLRIRKLQKNSTIIRIPIRLCTQTIAHFIQLSFWAIILLNIRFAVE